MPLFTNPTSGVIGLVLLAYGLWIAYSNYQRTNDAKQKRQIVLQVVLALSVLVLFIYGMNLLSSTQ